MSKFASKNGGNAAVLALVLLLVVGGAIGGYFYMSRAQPGDALPQTQESMEADRAVTEPEIAVDAEGNAVPSAAEEADIAPDSAGAVDIDLAAATSIRAVGNPEAPIKIVEYASLTCSHCGHFHNDVYPALKSKYIDTGKVYFEFREFPLNDPALKATLIARCLPEDKYEGFISLLFKTQGQWDAGLDYMKALRQNAKLAGMSDATFDACQEMPMLKLKIAESMQEAQEKWKVNATPTFIINDGAERLSGARPLEEFERVFRKLTDGAVGEAPPVE